MIAQVPDYGEVEYPGWFGRLRGRLPRIVREANYAAAFASLPAESKNVTTDPNGRWIRYELPDGRPIIRFRAVEAWLPNEPTIMPNRTEDTGAFVDSEGRIVVVEGLHRTRGMARERVMFRSELGAVHNAPGWLDFALDPKLMNETPSSQAIAQLLGGDPDAPLIRAR